MEPTQKSNPHFSSGKSLSVPSEANAKPSPSTLSPERMVTLTSETCTAIQKGKEIKVRQVIALDNNSAYSHSGMTVLEPQGYPVKIFDNQPFDLNAHMELEGRLLVNKQDVESKIQRDTKRAREQQVHGKKDRFEDDVFKTGNEVLARFKANHEWDDKTQYENVAAETTTTPSPWIKQEASFRYLQKGDQQEGEDRVLCTDIETRPGVIHVAGMFDGHTGAECAEYAVKTFPEALKDKLDGLDGVMEPRSMLCNGLIQSFGETNHRFKNSTAQGNRSGSTACVAVVHDGKITVANAGDSRALLVQKDGTAIQLSEDAQSWDEYYQKSIKLRQGVLKPDSKGITRINGRLAPARGFGDKDLAGVSARPKISEVAFRDGDTLLMTSDGLWRVVHQDQVAELVTYLESQGLSAENIAKNIILYAINVFLAYIEEDDDNNLDIDDISVVVTKLRTAYMETAV